MCIIFLPAGSFVGFAAVSTRSDPMANQPMVVIILIIANFVQNHYVPGA